MALYNSGEAFGSTIRIWLMENPYATPWLSQANYVFSQLTNPSEYGNYGLVEWVDFSVEIPLPEQTPPAAYLFLCSVTEFKTGPNTFRWPAYPAYWCLDPSGENPLTTEEASSLGFPSIQLKAEVRDVFWDDAVYAGARKFYEGKGIDPESQDVARQLGYPLYELSVPVPDVLEHQGWAWDEDDETEHASSAEDKCVHDDPAEPIQALPCCDDAVARQCTLGRLVELVKFGLILVLGLIYLYEQVRLVC
ncbi:hypothetical protein C8R45DRAFT_598378 [Mycena sanguinolenta]|nr:hypothetical protein C8R45DRAFT_598378 [Mycena sanguinolenta]